ncbi:hypothetical protein [Methanobrevibacter sp.]|uniref:hypothetical protein n=1 Tax=Methanobrevibacter sp. TaxID=66852 RepID=UPI00388FA3C1
MDELLENLAELEHVQWCEWAKSISIDINELLNIIEKNKDLDLSDEDMKSIDSVKDKMNRWNDLFISYSDLSEDMKDKDRVYARKVLDAVENQK